MIFFFMILIWLNLWFVFFFSIFSLWKKYDEIFGEIYVFFFRSGIFMIFLMILSMIFNDFLLCFFMFFLCFLFCFYDFLWFFMRRKTKKKH